MNARTFAALNLFAIAWVVVAALQPWVAAGSDPVPESLYRKWLPLALAFAVVGTAIVARPLDPTARGRIYARHFWLYLVPLALLIVGQFGGPAVLDGQLGAIYLLIPLAFCVHAVNALWAVLDRLTDRGAAVQIATITLVAALALLPYHRAVMPTASDEPHYLVVVQSLVVDHSLNVAKEYGSPDRYKSFYPVQLPDIHGIYVGVAIYSIRDLGLPFLAVIPFAIAGRLGVLALMCLVGAALAVQLYLLCRDLGLGARVSFLATASTALVHPILTYTTQVYPELLTALAFVSAVRVMRAGTAATPRQLAVASALVGALPWLSTRAWPTVVGVGLVIAYVAFRPADRSAPRTSGARVGAPESVPVRVAAGALPFLVLLLALCTLNWRTFGLFMPAAGYFLIRENQPVLTYTLQIGGPGLVLDRTFGLIPRAPIYLLSFLGAIPLVRRWHTHRIELVALVAGALLSFVYIGSIAYWWADGSPPSRYLLASLPLFVPAVAAGWEIVLGDALPSMWRSAARLVTWLAVGASAAIVYIFAVMPNVRYDLALDIRASGSSGQLFALLQRLFGVDPGRIFPSLVLVRSIDAALTVIWLLVAGALIIAGVRISTGESLSSEPRLRSPAA